mgnify:CR=1 FL=1
MKVSNHISMKINIVFAHLPKGVEGPECVRHLDHSIGPWSDLMKVSNHISMKMNIVFPHLPIGAEGPECVGHLDHSRGAWSDLITREVLGLIWSLERCWFSLVQSLERC